MKDIYELAELCLSKCYFLRNNEIRILKNSGPTGLFSFGCFIRKLRSEFGTQSHCRSIDLKSGSKNV